MNISLTCAPSFSEGFAIQIICHSSTDGKNEYFVKVGKLSDDAYVDFTQLALVFDRIPNPIKISEKDYLSILEYARNIKIVPEDLNMAVCDGVGYLLHIDSFGSDIYLNWNSKPQESWAGVKELVSLLEAMYNKYANLR